MLCSRCNKNVAVIMVTRMENGKTINEGLCMPCAQELGINTLQQLAGGMDQGDMENISDQMAEMLEASMPEEAMEELTAGDGDPKQSLRDMLDSVMGSLGFQGGSNPSAPKRDEAKDKKEAKEKEKEKKKRKLLDAYGTNLTEKARQGEVDRVIGRDREIERVVQILNRRTKNNPALLGEPGVGKTAIAEGLAMRIVEQAVSYKLLNKEVYLLDFTAIVAGTQYRGQFEARLKGIVEEVKRLGNIILVIDEMHNIVSAGDSEGAMSAANILKPALARGEIQVIGATTLGEYRKFIEKDAALERRFQTVMVEEPSVEETVEILQGIKGYYESYHRVKISDEVLRAAAVLSERYITDRFLPDKAIDLIDEAGSKANLNNDAIVRLEQLQEELRTVQEEKEAAVGEDSIENYQRAADLKTRECNLLAQISDVEAQIDAVSLTVEDVAAVVETWTKIPVRKITQAETERLLSLEEELHKHIIGQNQAVKAVANAMIRSRAALHKKRRPASFIFVGSTGVGKTELVKQLACALFDQEDALIRVDMTEYMEKHSVAKLIGSPPGYVGYDDAGQLTEKVRRKMYSVILFDEIEKAHPDVLNILLQILDDGRVTDSHGKQVSFENTVIVMTSNAGSDWKNSSLGFESDASAQNQSKALDALKRVLRPEFLNRVDEVVVFDALKREEINQILDLMMVELNDMLREKDMEVTLTDAAREVLIADGFDPKMGARPLRRAIARNLEQLLAQRIVRGERTPHLTADAEDGKIVLR